jgi:hypothetical protein
MTAVDVPDDVGVRLKHDILVNETRTGDRGAARIDILRAMINARVLGRLFVHGGGELRTYFINTFNLTQYKGP